MYLRDNPVLQRELLVNLRMKRAFVLLLFYVLVLGLVIYLAWPTESRLDLRSPAEAQRLFDIFFLGQFALVALMAPSFAAGSITGEKERKTYEMLLASPLLPTAVVLGKLLSSLCYLCLLIVSSLPLVMLCLLMGGIEMGEVIVVYVVLLLEAGAFGLISVAASSYFQRTSSALVVSYLAILPLALVAVVIWQATGERQEFRLFAAMVLLPPLAIALCAAVIGLLNQRLLHPPDIGSEGKEVVDEEEEARTAVGLVIDRDRFPDRLFAPAKRTDLLPDGANPVLDKELSSEIFAQGTLMLRVVIQVGMLLSIPLMAVFLFSAPQRVAYYVSYVVIFNMLVGPVFSAGAVTQERERQTLELLLTTLLKPSQIVLAKLWASLRVSTILTLLLTEQILLAYTLMSDLRNNFWTFFVFMGIILVTCLATTTIGLLSSVLCRKTATATMLTYLVILLLFAAPVATAKFLEGFTRLSYAEITRYTVTSPFTAALSVPVTVQTHEGLKTFGGGFPAYRYFALYVPACALLVGAMIQLFRWRWRAAQTL